MTFDHHSLERLRELRRNLPQPLPSSTPSPKNKKPDPRLHPIETEDNPQKLFKELINASPNGEVPAHLIDRLKEIESLNSIKKDPLDSSRNIKTSDKTVPYQSQHPSEQVSNQPNDLYIAFNQLLLEEE